MNIEEAMLTIDSVSINKPISRAAKIILKEWRKIKRSEKNDGLLEDILEKIDSKAITCEEFDEYISKCRIINETTPESIRDRIRRRTNRNFTKSHIDKNGHQQLKLPQFNKRIAPKRKPSNQQSHGRSKIAHNHSVRTQERMRKDFAEEIEFINANLGKEINESDISLVDAKKLKSLTAKLMITESENRDWLFKIYNMC